jgi:ABC-type lipoprotein release transport system permease subunit
VYGVVASLTRRRRQEIGLRVALGSTPAAAVGVVAGQGIRWVLAGLVVGIVGSTLAGRTIESLLVGVRPWDPAVLIGASLALVLAASAALWLPARRAAREGPAEVLKEE